MIHTNTQNGLISGHRSDFQITFTGHSFKPFLPITKAKIKHRQKIEFSSGKNIVYFRFLKIMTQKSDLQPVKGTSG